MNDISKVDRFDASWDIIEKREGVSLKQLKAIATVRSVGASNRIEGNKMTDAEVEVLIENFRVSKLEDRDEQEVAGYFEVLEEISRSYHDIEITEGNIKNLHNRLMKYCEKDAWHKGKYKQVSNAIEAKFPDGSKRIVFKTAEPGIETEDGMRNLIKWYHTDTETLQIIKDALFIYEFLSIHPFQDGNGRMSRLIGTLLLMKHGYTWVQYVSFEHEIESRKAEYYQVLMETQRQRPGESVDQWVLFFLDCMLNIQGHLEAKLKTRHQASNQGTKEKKLISFIENHPGCKSGEISKKLNIPLPTVKKILANLVEQKLIIKNGIGPGTHYHSETRISLKSDLMFKLTSKEIRKEFHLNNQGHQITLKKIVLVPLFKWTKPDDWSSKLLNQGLSFRIQFQAGQNQQEAKYALIAYNNPFLYQPVFELSTPISLPLTFVDQLPPHYQYPIHVTVELEFSTKKIDFEVLFVYDEEGS
jgi:Fic family protein